MDKWIGFIPFLTLKGEGQKGTFRSQRIIEAILIALLTAFFTSYTQQVIMKTELKEIKRDISRIEVSVTQIKRDFYKPFISND
ncbi:MAG TPA: hypothetical protein ENI76_02800 [Ignavibacteria bacterium]|nr:hypothetical protein [Ignavibacteria bacterium]